MPSAANPSQEITIASAGDGLPRLWTVTAEYRLAVLISGDHSATARLDRFFASKFCVRERNFSYLAKNSIMLLKRLFLPCAVILSVILSGCGKNENPENQRETKKFVRSFRITTRYGSEEYRLKYDGDRPVWFQYASVHQGNRAFYIGMDDSRSDVFHMLRIDDIEQNMAYGMFDGFLHDNGNVKSVIIGMIRRFFVCTYDSSGQLVAIDKELSDNGLPDNYTYIWKNGNPETVVAGDRTWVIEYGKERTVPISLNVLSLTTRIFARVTQYCNCNFLGYAGFFGADSHNLPKRFVCGDTVETYEYEFDSCGAVSKIVITSESDEVTVIDIMY